MGVFRTSLVLLLPLVVACSELQTLRDNLAGDGNGAVPVIDGNRGVHGWLADLHALRAQPPEALSALLDARESAFRKKPVIENRMRLVMLLLVDEPSVRDEKRARQLLGRVDPLPESTNDREFVSLLKQMLDGQQAYEEKLSVLWKQATQQNRRIDELEQQLKALTNIEQNIQQREPPPVSDDGK